MEDVPLAQTEELVNTVEGRLRFDDVISRLYTSGSNQVGVYIAYWEPGKVPVRMVGVHTPDTCWSAWLGAMILTSLTPRSLFSYGTTVSACSGRSDSSRLALEVTHRSECPPPCQPSRFSRGSSAYLGGHFGFFVAAGRRTVKTGMGLVWDLDCDATALRRVPGVRRCAPAASGLRPSSGRHW
jgi:hypothetical protein